MMIDTPCARSQCPEMPKVSLDQAVVDLMESIALQETALSTFVVPKPEDAEGHGSGWPGSLQAAGGERLRHQYGARRRKLELVLKDKLEFVSNNLYVPGDSGCPSPAQ